MSTNSNPEILEALGVTDMPVRGERMLSPDHRSHLENQLVEAEFRAAERRTAEEIANYQRRAIIGTPRNG